LRQDARQLWHAYHQGRAAAFVIAAKALQEALTDQLSCTPAARQIATINGGSMNWAGTTAGATWCGSCLHCNRLYQKDL
jgi:uncharacterized membrane protein